jgi:hypothetical protein
MWECRKCQEKIEDRFKHCWNCGARKPDAGQEDSSPVRIHLKVSPPAKESTSEIAPPAPEAEIPPENSPEKVSEDETAPRKISAERESVQFERPVPQTEFTFGNAVSIEEKAPSKIGSFVPLVLWLAAAIGVGTFAYHSNRKTNAFENRLREESAVLASQAKQFVFSKNAPREKKGTISAKVLPLGANNKEIDGLYYVLPDELRPASIDEVKTILWLDCKSSESGFYEDGSPAFRDKCNAYLVDRNTSKVVQVQDFSGEPPPLKKGWGTSYASGKVLPESYIAYIQANQPEAERASPARADDSLAHHVLFKSEMLYAAAILILLAAVAAGWMIYKIKSAWRPE